MNGRNFDSRAREGFRAARRGDVRPARALLCTPASGLPSEQLWRTTLSTCRWLADPSTSHFPDWAEVETALKNATEHPEPAALLCGQLANAALIAFDRDYLQRLVPYTTAIREHTNSREAQLTCRLVEAWARFSTGDLPHDDEVKSYAKTAVRAGLAPLVIEAQVLRTLLALHVGDLRTGTQLARRTSRMARTESLPQPEYLAHLALARLRRSAGQPYLAARILTALARAAPGPWRGWLAWELLLAGLTDEAESLAREATITEHLEPRSVQCAQALHRMIRAAQDGARPQFEACQTDLLQHTEQWGPIAVEAQTACWLVDGSCSLEAMSPSARAWCEGKVDAAPNGLEGIAFDPVEHQTAIAYVAAGSGRRPRRILAIGAPLLTKGEEAHRLLQSHRQRGRVDVATAVLLCEPLGLTDEDFFKKAYGFNYTPAIHRSVFHVLKHRIRENLASVAKLERIGDRNVLRLDRLVLAPDPRCQRPVTDRVLWILAAGKAEARDIAAQVGISIRLTQVALRQLQDDGSCQLTKVGRKHYYRLEDTTFSEPTLA